MKKVSLIKALTLFLGVLLLTTSVFQCTKVGDNIQHLDRSYPNTPDSTIYASFYDEFKIATADVTPATNDIIKFRGVQTILHEYCGTSNCHGGSIDPRFDTYGDIMKYVVAGNPSGSKLWEMITTNDFNKAMPPVNSNHELNTKDKAIVFNWIRNGAKEKPDLADFRPAAIRLIVDGCGSANCHNQATVAGAWAEKGVIGTRYNIAATDTASFYFYDAGTGALKRYCQLVNNTKLSQIWNDYKDSVKTYYGDTINKASFRILKTFTAPWSASVRGPLGNYDDILLDITYPKNIRSNGSPVFTDPVTGVNYYSKSNHLNSDDCFIRRIDSTVKFYNPHTGNPGSTNKPGNMSWEDGGLSPSEIALIKAWYFADPNIPDVWKYGKNNTGIFKYNKPPQNPIIKR
ncbi:MAG TPA: c-type cytochrome domain-containing protein [Chitinophagaceae bacterium]|nr:c-type cytochrome domain-containing protein [Chitinophagaceae bacterium]